MPTSHHDEAAFFVDREDILQLIHGFMVPGQSEPGCSSRGQSPIMVIVGPGGSGKTTLAQRLRTECKAMDNALKSVWLDFSDAELLTIEGALAKLERLIEKEFEGALPALRFPRYHILCERLAQCRIDAYGSMHESANSVGDIAGEIAAYVGLPFSPMLARWVARHIVPETPLGSFYYRALSHKKVRSLLGITFDALDPSEGTRRVGDVLDWLTTNIQRDECSANDEDWFGRLQRLEKRELGPLMCSAFSADLRSFLSTLHPPHRLVLIFENYEHFLRSASNRRENAGSFLQQLFGHRLQASQPIDDALFALICCRDAIINDEDYWPPTWRIHNFETLEHLPATNLATIGQGFHVLNVQLSDFDANTIQKYMLDHRGFNEQSIIAYLKQVLSKTDTRKALDHTPTVHLPSETRNPTAEWADQLCDLTLGYPLFVGLVGDTIETFRSTGGSASSQHAGVINARVEERLDATKKLPNLPPHKYRVGQLIYEWLLAGEEASGFEGVLDNFVLPRRLSRTMVSNVYHGDLSHANVWNRLVGYSFTHAREPKPGESNSVKGPVLEFHPVLRRIAIARRLDDPYESDRIEQQHEEFRRRFEEAGDNEALYHAFALDAPKALEQWRELLLTCEAHGNSQQRDWLLILARDVLDDRLIDFAERHVQSSNLRVELRCEIALSEVMQSESGANRLSGLQSLARDIGTHMTFLRTRMQLALGGALCDTDDLEGAAQSLDEANYLFDQLQADREQEAAKFVHRAMLIQRARVYQLAGSYDDAIHLFRDALELVTEPVQEAELRQHLASTLAADGAIDQAMDELRSAISLDRESSNQLRLAELLKQEAGLWLIDCGNLDQALQRAQESDTIAKELFERRQLRKPQAQIADTLGRIQCALGNYDAAVTYHNTCVQIKRSMSDSGGEAYALSNAGIAHLLGGEIDEARQCCQAAVSLRPMPEHPAGDYFGAIRARLAMALADGMAHDNNAVRTALADVRSLLELKPLAIYDVQEVLLRAELTLIFGLNADFLPRPDESLRVAKILHTPAQEARYHLLMALYTLRHGKERSARRHTVMALTAAGQFAHPDDVTCHPALVRHILLTLHQTAGDWSGMSAWLEETLDGTDLVTQPIGDTLARLPRDTPPQLFHWPGYYVR